MVEEKSYTWSGKAQKKAECDEGKIMLEEFEWWLRESWMPSLYQGCTALGYDIARSLRYILFYNIDNILSV